MLSKGLTVSGKQVKQHINVPFSALAKDKDVIRVVSE